VLFLNHHLRRNTFSLSKVEILSINCVWSSLFQFPFSFDIHINSSIALTDIQHKTRFSSINTSKNFSFQVQQSFDDACQVVSTTQIPIPDSSTAKTEPNSIMSQKQYQCKKNCMHGRFPAHDSPCECLETNWCKDPLCGNRTWWGGIEPPKTYDCKKNCKHGKFPTHDKPCQCTNICKACFSQTWKGRLDKVADCVRKKKEM